MYKYSEEQAVQSEMARQALKTWLEHVSEARRLAVRQAIRDAYPDLDISEQKAALELRMH